MKILFGVAALVMVLLGAAWLLFPESSLSSWGVGPEAGAVYLGRRYGVLFLGYAVILWCGRASEPSPARRAILLGNAFVNGGMTLVSLVGVTTHVVGPSVWSAAAVEGLLAAAFACSYALSPRSPGP
jgi:nitrate reductase gamma subunit